MSRQLKLILFVLVFNAIGFAEGNLLRDLGLVVGADSHCDGVGGGAGESKMVDGALGSWTRKLR